MRRRWMEPEPPHGRDDAEYVRGGRNGAWWQAPDGMQVRIAAAEPADPAARDGVDRSRLSFLAVIAALIAGGRSRV